MKKLHILFLTHYDNMYGANKAMYKLIKELKTGMDLDITLAIPSEGEMTEALSKIGVSWFVCGQTKWQAEYTTPLRFFVKKAMRKSKIKKEVDELYEHFKDKSVDIVHSNSSVTSLGAMLAERLGAKHIWHIREFSYEHFNMRYFYSDKRVRELYEKAECLVTISDALKENIKAKYPKANVIRVYDGVTGDYEQAKGKEDGVFRFVYVGYLYPMKQQLEVLQAAKILNDQGIGDYEVYIVGDGNKDYKDKLLSYKEKHELTNVIFTGYEKDVHSLLNSMNGGLIASRYEGFGLVTVEYMLHGLPVIGYKDGGTAEIVKQDETGYLYDELSQLVEYMKELIVHRDKAKALGEAGQIRAKEHFTEELNGQNLMEIYHKWIAEN